jgi:hypothetical protein
LSWPKGLATLPVLTPYFLPRIYCAVAAVLSLIMFASDKSRENVGFGSLAPLGIRRFFLFAGIFIVYLALLRYAHFLVSTALLVGIVVWLTGTKPVKALIIGVVSSMACYLFFEKLFTVMLP